jgi:NADPH:quinone reductase-like Zn-dependent oxidoreductase
MASERQPAAATGQATLPLTAENTMAAIVQDGYGSADVLHLGRIPRPRIEGHEVLLRVHAAGNPSLSRLRRALTPAGTAVLTGGENGGNLTGMGRPFRAVAMSPLVRQRLTMLIPRQRSADLDRLSSLIEAGTLTPSIGATYPLDQAAEAMRYLEAGKACGKIAITI